MISERVQQGALQMGIALPPEAAERFALYHALLVEGTARMNLTTVLEPEEAVDRHFLDSLAPVALGLLPQGARAVDVGTGAGFPGIPLLIARPDLRLTLVDSLNKRLEFLRDVLNRLGLSAEIVHMRAEDFSHQAAHREQYDVATARGRRHLLEGPRRGGGGGRGAARALPARREGAGAAALRHSPPRRLEAQPLPGGQGPANPQDLPAQGGHAHAESPVRRAHFQNFRPIFPDKLCQSSDENRTLCGIGP